MKNLILKSLLVALTLGLIAQPTTTKAWSFKDVATYGFILFAAWGAYQWATEPSTPKQKRVLTSIPAHTPAQTNASATVRTQPAQQQILIESGDITGSYGIKCSNSPGNRSVIVNAANSDINYTVTNGGFIAQAIRDKVGVKANKNRIADINNNQKTTVKPGNATAIRTYGGLASLHSSEIFAVGPDCRIPDQNQNRRNLLKNAYQNAFKQASICGAKKVVTPALSTGAFGYNYDNYNEAANIAIEQARLALKISKTIKQIVFVSTDAKVRAALEQALAKQ